MQNFSQYLTYRSLLAKKQGKGFSEAEVKEILQQALNQLAKFHDRNQAHGSISLDTVAHDPSQMQVVLVAGNGNSNPVYLAPEVLQTKQSTPSGDIYALGVVIIVLLTGMPPEALKLADGKWNWQDRCIVSDQFIQILNIALNPNRSFRYVNAAQMLKALQELIGSNNSAKNVNSHISTAPTIIQTAPAPNYAPTAPVAYQAAPQSYDPNANNVTPLSQNTPLPQNTVVPPLSPTTNQGLQTKPNNIKKKLIIVLAILGGSLLTGGLAFGGYWYYQLKKSENNLQVMQQVSKAIGAKSVDNYKQIAEAKVSNQLLLTAKSNYEKTGDLSNAETVLAAVSPDSRVRNKAEELKKKLQSDAQQNNNLIKQAEKYYQEGKWQLAIDATSKVSATPYWQERKKKIVKDSQARLAEASVPPPPPLSAPAPVAPAPVAPAPVAEQPRAPDPIYEPPYEEPAPAPAPTRPNRPLFGPGSY
jgi:serine/threonine protein kinase